MNSPTRRGWAQAADVARHLALGQRRLGPGKDLALELHASAGDLGVVLADGLIAGVGTVEELGLHLTGGEGGRPGHVGEVSHDHRKTEVTRRRSVAPSQRSGRASGALTLHRRATRVTRAQLHHGGAVSPVHEPQAGVPGQPGPREGEGPGISLHQPEIGFRRPRTVNPSQLHHVLGLGAGRRGQTGQEEEPAEADEATEHGRIGRGWTRAGMVTGALGDRSLSV